ncbi:MAG: cardiolipin synthase [Verrucomicrobia bacterium]|nr:cardiolipin synthase [Verrucomicrobiota bacterium]MBV8277254.1 cardiolipin synthase [Verrucomicrobiota bacterium]
MLLYVPQRRSASAARTWLLFIFLLPWPGLAIYALVGRIRVPAFRRKLQVQASEQIEKAQAQIGTQIVAQLDLPAQLQIIPEQAKRLGMFEPFAGNAFEFLRDYEESIDRLIQDIDSAERQVHLLTYIYRTDRTGRKVTDALKRAARRGVACRVLLDAVGSRVALKQFGPALRQTGVEVRSMLPVGLFRRKGERFDLRNHRKITVIDGTIGYLGSQNIADPTFVRNYPNEELVVRVTGPVVSQLQATFLGDHYLETEQVLDREELFPSLKPAGNSAAQLLPSGPGYGQENGRELIISMLYEARRRVVIITPYFIPDEPFLNAICAAGERENVQVHLVVSKHANQLISQLAQRSYYDDLLEAGIQIHLYRPRFLHAKLLTIDDDIALTGSTNMDIRSFALNAEINLLIYDRQIVEQLKVVQEDYFRNSDLLTLEQWRKRSALEKVVQNTARLMDSFL